MVDDFFDKITSEKYKQKVEQRKLAIELAISAHNRKVKRKMVKKLLIAQLVPLGALIATITLFILFLV